MEFDIAAKAVLLVFHYMRVFLTCIWFIFVLRWRGSIYKILWKEFVIFASAYFSLSFIYRFVLIRYPVYKR